MTDDDAVQLADDLLLDEIVMLMRKARAHGLPLRLIESDLGDLSQDAAADLLDELREQLEETHR